LTREICVSLKTLTLDPVLLSPYSTHPVLESKWLALNLCGAHLKSSQDVAWSKSSFASGGVHVAVVPASQTCI